MNVLPSTPMGPPSVPTLPQRSPFAIQELLGLSRSAGEQEQERSTAPLVPAVAYGRPHFMAQVRRVAVSNVATGALEYTLTPKIGYT